MKTAQNWLAVVTFLLLFCVLPGDAQIEKQAQTYDLTVSDCLTGTFLKNPEICRVRADVERAMGTKLVYRSRALPQLTGQVQGGIRSGDLYLNPPVNNLDPFAVLSAQFSQPLIDVGIPPTLRRGRLEVVIAQQNLNRAVTERMHETRVTFLQALYLQDLIAVYEEIGKRLQANVDSEQQRLDVGTGREAALKQAKIQMLNLERDIANWRGNYFSAVTRLAELDGRDLTGTSSEAARLRLPQPVGELLYQRVKLDMAREAAYALKHRADLKLLQALSDAALNDKRIVQAGYFPLVSLVASTVYFPQNALLSKQTDTVPGRDTLSTEYRAGAAFSWSIIDNGRVTGASRRAEATRQGYEIVLHELEQNISRELAAVEGALRNADARRQALLESAAAAEENLKLIETQVALGQATQFDFLKAQSNLLLVRAGILDATYAHEIARAEVDHVTGRYLEFHVDADQPVASSP